MQKRDVGSREAAAVDEELLNFPVHRDGLKKLRGCVMLGLIGGRGNGGHDQRRVYHRGDVPLVAIEGLGFALSAVPHLRVSDRTDAVLGDALTNATLARLVGVGLRILSNDALEHLHGISNGRLLEHFSCAPLSPGEKRLGLSQKLAERRLSCRRVVPIDVESGLDART
ncbi:MAG: hypothetical protein JWN04_5034 [Myxococcaceae bacterium]|nr:hypothetical protein [Myxococcaceae bacterium]